MSTLSDGRDAGQEANYVLDEVQAGLAGDKGAYQRFQDELNSLPPEDRAVVAQEFKEKYNQWRTAANDNGFNVPKLDISFDGDGYLDDIDLITERSWWWDKETDIYDRPSWGEEVWKDTRTKINDHYRRIDEVMEM